MSVLETDLVQAATGTNTALKLKGKGSGVVKLGDGELSFPDADGSSGQAIQTNASGTLSFGSTNVPTSADGQALGSASAEWSDLYLADSGVIYFGNDQEITLTHVADDGLIIKHVGTGDGKEPSLTFQAGDNDIAVNDVLGSIFFQAPDEGAGTDAILVAAGIEAVSEGNFAADNNATKLSFKTAASEAASEKMSLSSAGLLTVADDIVIKDGGTIGGSADADLLTLGNGVLTVTGKLSLADAGYVDISTPLLAGADHTYTGTTAQMLAGGAIAAFDLVCIHTTTGEVVEADASAYATARVIGIAPAAISDTATGTVLLHGFIRDDTWNWTTGSTLYASETAGAMTHTAPTTDGAFVQVVGVALEPDVVYINPSMDVIEHA